MELFPVIVYGYDESQLVGITNMLIMPVVIHPLGGMMVSRYTGNMLTEMNRKNEKDKVCQVFCYPVNNE